MKNKPTFQEQYNKIVSAYMKNELKPFDNCACFIGNLLNGKRYWSGCRVISKRFDEPFKHEIVLAPIRTIFQHFTQETIDTALNIIREESGGMYEPIEILSLEECFLKMVGYDVDGVIDEEKLFLAMESTLLMLKSIHEYKGEMVNDYQFTKRELVLA